MSKTFVLVHRYKPELSLTLGVDDQFLRVLEVLHINVFGVNQEELEIFLGILSVLQPEITIKRRPLSKYVLRYM